MIVLLSFLLTILSKVYIDRKANQLKVKYDIFGKIIEFEREKKLDIQVIQGTFLGNERRNYYGNNLPDSLRLIWKHEIGCGPTVLTKGTEQWCGAGWTGQPLIIKEKNGTFLIQGCYDHHLKKINIQNGELVWQYQFDDIQKGTGTIYINPYEKDSLNKILILQGSRLGIKNKLRQDTIPSFRAISYYTGKEVWRINVKNGPSFSRDVDGSALVLNDTIYIGLENGYFSILSPNSTLNKTRNYSFNPIIREYPLFTDTDKKIHRGELVIESSPSLLHHHIYITAGSGHLYGYNLKTHNIDYDLYVGSDINGSPVITNDDCILITLEKEFIKGNGGVMKVNPSKEQNIEWYLPTGNKIFSGWEGGIVGTASTNDYFDEKNSLACTNALDGYLYLFDYKKTHYTDSVVGPDGFTKYPTPIVYDKYEIGPSISTPIFIKNKICTAGYNGIFLFEITPDKKLKLIANYPGIYEATPTAYNNRIYIASKGGHLYCLGN